MAVYRAFLTYTFGDKNGDEATLRVRTFVPDTALVSDLATNSTDLGAAIGAPGHLSNAKVVRRGLAVLLDEAQLSAGTPPLDAEFPSVTDKAVFGFASAAGFNARLALPAPIEAIFHAPPSDATIDPTNAAAAAFITAVEAILQGAPSSFLNLYTGGTRTGQRARLRRGNST